MKKVILSQLILITSILISCTDKLENTEVNVSIQNLKNNSLQQKKTSPRFPLLINIILQTAGITPVQQTPFK